MPFVSSCCCSHHDEWKHGAVDSNNLRQCTREEAEILDFASNDPKNKNRKRKICISCRSRLQVEEKCSKLEVSSHVLDSHATFCAWNARRFIRHDFEIALYELPFPLSGLHPANYRFLAFPFVYYIGSTLTDIIRAEIHHFGNAANKRFGNWNFQILGERVLSWNVMDLAEIQKLWLYFTILQYVCLPVKSCQNYTPQILLYYL